MTLSDIFAGAAALTLGLGLTGAALAQETTDYVEQEFGYLGCGLEFQPTLEDFSLEDAKRVALERGAYGFVYWAEKMYSAVLSTPFPDTCRPEASSDWKLYLPTTPVEWYTRVDYGFDGCDVNFGPLMTNTTEFAMFRAAREAGAEGFTFHPDLAFGKVMVGAYPAGCSSPANMSWPLYLHTPG